MNYLFRAKSMISFRQIPHLKSGPSRLNSLTFTIGIHTLIATSSTNAMRIISKPLGPMSLTKSLLPPGKDLIMWAEFKDFLQKNLGDDWAFANSS